jgi:DsbC/DsbD-like thiol-disulfide interchange protein
MTRRIALLALFGIVAATSQVLGQGAKKSDSVVKVSAAADKPDAGGRQTVTVTLAIDAGWHTYANPVGLEDLADTQTTISFTGNTKPEVLKIDYPAGKVVKDKTVGDYKIYEDKAAIKATVRRAKGDTSPLEVTVKFQACNESKCLLPATVKVPVQ